MALSAKYRSNAFVQRDPNQTLTIKRKAFANNIGITVNGVMELSRYIASVRAYIASDRLILEELSLDSVNKNATIHLLEENGWDHRCCQQKDFNASNLFTQGKGIPSTKTVSITQSLGSSSVAAPKTIAQLMTQRAALTNATNVLPARDYTGHITLSDAAKTTNAITGKKAMGANAFANCPRLKSVRMSSDNAWGEFFSTGCFKSCAALTTINTVTNSNSSMSLNVAVVPPPGTISVASGSTAVTGSNGTLFTTRLLTGQMLYTASSTREGGKYIGTVHSIQSDTQLTLTLPSALGTSYTGTFRVTTEALIPAHATTVGQEALRGTNVRVVTFESHLNPTLAASNSRLVSIGSNAFTDCPNLATLHFSVKQSSALTRLGVMSDSVIPLGASLNVISTDGWASTVTQAQLSTLLNVVSTRFLSTPKFSYIARFEMVDNIPPMRRLATITGIASQDEPVSFRNLVIPEYIMHSDGILYQVFDIDYPFIDQTEVIVGQPNREYGAFSKTHPAFNVGGQVGSLTGTLTMSKTLRKVGNNSFMGQSLLSGNLTIAGINLTRIGSQSFLNSYFNGGTLLIMGKTLPSVAASSFRGTSFIPEVRTMNSVELSQYAF
jgi:hypothetical protein